MRSGEGYYFARAVSWFCSTGGDGAPGWEQGPGWVFGSLQSTKNAQGGFPKAKGLAGGSAPAAPDVLSSFTIRRASGAHAICRRSQGAPGLISFLDPGAGGEARSGSREQRGRQQMIRSCGHPRSRDESEMAFPVRLMARQAPAAWKRRDSITGPRSPPGPPGLPTQPRGRRGSPRARRWWRRAGSG